MEKHTMGALMSALRKSKGMTQQDVADKLGVSNKSVSKWECDDGYPDISMLPAIAEIYGVTVDELLKGEIKNEEKEEKNTSSEKGRKQIELIISGSFEKFKNLSVVALVFSILSVVLVFIISSILMPYGQLLNTTSALIALSVAIILSVVGVVIEWFAGNRLTFSLSGEDAGKCEDYVISYLKSARKYIALVLGFALTGVSCGIAIYLSAYYDLLEFPAIVVGIAVSFVLTLILSFFAGNKLLSHIDNEENKRKAAYERRTAVRIAAGTLCIAIVMSTVIGVVGKATDTRSFTFDDEETYNDFISFALEGKLPLIEKDYDNMKVTVADMWYYRNAFTVVDDGIDEPEELVDTETDEISLTFADGERYLVDVNIYTFSSKNAMDKFIDDYCISSSFFEKTSLSLIHKRGYISDHNDNELTVKYKVGSFSDMTGPCAIFVSVVCVLYAIIYSAVRKNKAIKM